MLPNHESSQPNTSSAQFVEELNKSSEDDDTKKEGIDWHIMRNKNEKVRMPICKLL